MFSEHTHFGQQSQPDLQGGGIGTGGYDTDIVGNYFDPADQQDASQPQQSHPQGSGLAALGGTYASLSADAHFPGSPLPSSGGYEAQGTGQGVGVPPHTSPVPLDMTSPDSFDRSLDVPLSPSLTDVPDQNTEPYTAVSGTVDDLLRLETSIYTLKQQKLLHDTTIGVRDSIVGAYQTHIQPDALARTTNVQDRVIVMDKECFDEFYSQWENSGYQPDDGIVGHTSRVGGIIAIKDPEIIWHQISNDDQKLLIQRFGDESAARDIVANVCLNDTLTHEIMHQFEGPLTELFSEIGVRYYQRQITDKLGLGNLATDNQLDSI